MSMEMCWGVTYELKSTLLRRDTTGEEGNFLTSRYHHETLPVDYLH